MPATRGVSQPRSRRRRRFRELASFGAVGTACLVLDVAVFQLLYAALGVDAVVAKLVAALTATTVAFLGHRTVTYADRPRTGPRRQYLLFGLVNGATVLLGLGIVAVVRHPLGQEDPVVLQGASLTGIAVGTVVRFVVYRRWVFAAAPRSAASPAPAREVSPVRT